MIPIYSTTVLYDKDKGESIQLSVLPRWTLCQVIVQYIYRTKALLDQYIINIYHHLSTILYHH